jgi:dTDP-4-amino-4,6-dideoxygalactose transaminase
MSIFSFHPVKPITTAEGGAITTNDPKMAHTLAMLRNHGIERDSELFDGTPPEQCGPWSYEQQQLGFNYRLSDLQAALGIAQLSKLDRFLERRRKIAAYYDEQFGGSKYFKPIQSNPDFRSRSGHHLYAMQIDFEALNKSRKQVMSELQEKGIGTQVHYIPIHRQPYHKHLKDRSADDFHHAEHYYTQALSIPFYPSMTDSDINRVVEEIETELG